MKRLLFCLFVLISAAAISNVEACTMNKKSPSTTSKTYIGTFTEDVICECRDEKGDYCPECASSTDWCVECYTPAFIIDGVVYFVSSNQWENVRSEYGLKLGEQIELSGILFSEYCVDYIEVVSIKKQKLAIGDAKAAPASLDLQQPMYNMLGVPVDENYKGVVIQNGTKYVIY